MNNLLKVVALTLALVLFGVGHANAYWYGPTTVSHDGKARGDGKGHFIPVGWDGVRLKEPTAKDRLEDGMRTFISAKAWKAGAVATVQSGRRGDGKNTWFTMIDRTTYAGTSSAGMSSWVKVCMDRAWAKDPCKESEYRLNW